MDNHKAILKLSKLGRTKKALFKLIFASLACGNVFFNYFSQFLQRELHKRAFLMRALWIALKRALKEQVRAHRRPFDVLNAIFIKVSHAAQQICGKATFYLHFNPTPQYVKVTALNRKNDRPGDHGRLRRV